MRRLRKKRASELTPLIDVLFILLFASLIQARSVASGENTARSSRRAEDSPTASRFDAGAAAATRGEPDAGLPDAGLPDASDADPLDASAAGTSYGARSLLAAQTMASAIGNKPVTVVEIAATGHLEAITYWSQGAITRRDQLNYPLLYEVPGDESDFEIDYRGEINQRHRLCSIVRDHSGQVSPPGHTGETVQDTGQSSQHPDADVRQPDPRAVADSTPGADRADDSPARTSEMIVLVTTDAPYSDLPWALRRGLERDSERCFNGFRGLAILIKPPDESYER